MGHGNLSMTYMPEEPPLFQQKESLICSNLPRALLCKTHATHATRIHDTPDKEIKQTCWVCKKNNKKNKTKLNSDIKINQNSTTALATRLSPNSLLSRAHNPHQGAELVSDWEGEGGLSSPSSTQGRGLQTGLTSVSPKRATEQKGLG